MNGAGVITSRHLTKALLFVLAVCGCALLYLHVAAIQSGVNQDMSSIDQGAYMDFARRARESGWQYTGGRNRMPLYPWMMALFHEPEMTDDDFFERGKRVNVWLSLLMLALLGAAFFRRFPRFYAGYAILCIAFLVFAIKSPFFQVELLYYGLFALAFALALEDLAAPDWRKSVAAGLLFALTHFAKASALPALLLYLAAHALLCVARMMRRDCAWRQALSPAMNALLAALAFVALLFPYLQESRERYGSHFYNVNTTFYIWYDSWTEAKAGTRAAGDRVGYPDLPPEEIPSLAKYLREHTPRQMVKRFRDGAQWLTGLSCSLDFSLSRYGYCSQVAAGLLVMLCSLPLMLRQSSRRGLLAAAPLTFFVTAVFAVYALGAAWYIPILGTSTRVLLVLAAPFFWTLGLVLHSGPLQALHLRVGARRISVARLVLTLLSLTLVYEIWLVAGERAATMYGAY